MRRVLASAFVFLAILFIPTFAFATSSTLVISEFRTRGPNGANDEFVEIYNVTNGALNIGGFTLRMSDTMGNTTTLATVPANVSLPAKRFYLFANVGTQGYSGSVTPNVTYTIGIPDNGGIALYDGTSTAVDEVGMSTMTQYVEGTPLAPLTNSVNQSYERNDGGCAATIDTDNNAGDFRLNALSSNPNNSTSTDCLTSPCTGVVCKSPASPCYTSPGTCTAGSCSYKPFAVGALCNDGDACTTGDKCDASLNCVPTGATQCTTPPASSCSNANTLVTYSSTGTCSSSTGCSYTSTTTNCPFGCDGTAKQCKPDPCTSVTCNTPPNDCYQAGSGQCVNGKCVFTPLAAKTACNDGNQCTTGDACDGAGKCAGSAVSVDDGEPCTTDACDPVAGITHTPVADATNCDDGNLCNGIATCQSGKCTNGAPKTCTTPPIGGCYAATGTCNPTNGACTYQPSSPGTTCDDGQVCTTNDACDGNGTCGGSAIVCTAGTPTCVDANTSRTFTAGTCQTSSGSCNAPSTDKHCDFGCDSASGLCKQDPCIGKTCTTPPSSQCYQATGTCSNGTCSYAVTADASCDDGDPCTNNDKCSAAGACAGTPLACNTPALPTCKDSVTSTSQDASGTCSNGTCSYTSHDTNCPFGCDATSGLCVGDPCKNVTCDSPPDQCHQSTGTCGSDGKCTYALKTQGSPCDDGKTCTTNDTCDESGNCAGETACNTPPAATCDQSSPTSHGFDAAGACDDTGACKYDAVDKSCTAGCNTTSGLCNNDPCNGVTCTTPPGGCYEATGTCNNGACGYAARDTTASCDDGNSCTSDDHCDGHGTCVGTAVNDCGVDAGSGGQSGAGGKAGGSGGASAGGAPSAGGGAHADASVGQGGAANVDAGAGGGQPTSLDGGVLKPDSGKTTISGGGSGSCGCSVPRSSSSTAWPLGLLALSMLAVRRRRK
ncbi:MAG TPA: lamin tail domain-containing protein [Polyangiaceae bacterium]|nr:lamin tail domain-containing protein [Polyangiaceae bacterium]